MNIQNLGIEDALNRLQEKFPDEHLEAHYYHNWFGRNERMFSLVFSSRGDLTDVRGFGATWEDAQADLEANKGLRNPLEIKQAKIESLRAELAKLEGETK